MEGGNEGEEARCRATSGSGRMAGPDYARSRRSMGGGNALAVPRAERRDIGGRITHEAVVTVRFCRLMLACSRQIISARWANHIPDFVATA